MKAALLSALLSGPVAVIGGQDAGPAQFPAVVLLEIGDTGCTGTVVGPRVVLTAAHCGVHAATSLLHLGDRTIPARNVIAPGYDEYYSYLNSPEGPDLDLALAITSSDIPGIVPIPIGGTPAVGASAEILGYGCNNENHENGGVLRFGFNTISRFLSSGFVLSGAGAVGCNGDSGGPSLLGGRVVGVNAQADLTSSTWAVRTDSAPAQGFFRGVAARERVVICGVTGSCP